MKKLAVFLYKKVCIYRVPLFGSGQVEIDLAQLHPGERVEYIKTEYYVKKITLFLAILFAGAFLGLAARINARKGSSLEGNRLVYRESYESGERQLLLAADDGEDKNSFLIEVYPRILSQSETETLADAFLKDIETYILGKNQDIRHITTDLKLEEAYEGFPFDVSWESSREEVLDSSGRVGNIASAVSLELKVTLTYRDYTRTETLQAVVEPAALSQEEQEYLELREYLLETEEESRGKDIWSLPEEWKGKKLEWSLETKDYSFLIWASTPAVAALLYLSADKDLHKELEKRRRSLGREYPELVHKLLLYVGAGMTIRGAFKKIGGDYEKKKQKTGKVQLVCEEVLYTCRELQGGVSEGAAYEHFGKRAGSREYIRLGTLLGQNLKRGNSTLLERLREEAEKVSGESLLRVRKLGEEAGTKLLFPMVMMLAVVMVMIMVPAFGTM